MEDADGPPSAVASAALPEDSRRATEPGAVEARRGTIECDLETPRVGPSNDRLAGVEWDKDGGAGANAGCGMEDRAVLVADRALRSDPLCVGECGRDAIRAGPPSLAAGGPEGSGLVAAKAGQAVSDGSRSAWDGAQAVDVVGRAPAGSRSGSSSSVGGVEAPGRRPAVSA